MPAHSTPQELAIREARRKKREQEGKQLQLFTAQNIAHEMTEWIQERNGHHWRWRSWGTHAECVFID